MSDSLYPAIDALGPVASVLSMPGFSELSGPQVASLRRMYDAARVEVPRLVEGPRRSDPYVAEIFRRTETLLGIPEQTRLKFN